MGRLSASGRTTGMLGVSWSRQRCSAATCYAHRGCAACHERDEAWQSWLGRSMVAGLSRPCRLVELNLKRVVWIDAKLVWKTWGSKSWGLNVVWVSQPKTCPRPGREAKFTSYCQYLKMILNKASIGSPNIQHHKSKVVQQLISTRQVQCTMYNARVPPQTHLTALVQPALSIAKRRGRLAPRASIRWRK